MHWRPAQYWAKGTTVKVSVNALGVNLGGGVYGAANASTNFTIGRSLIAIADNNSHYTQVFVDGVMVRNMAVQHGQGRVHEQRSNGTQIHFWTQDGVHVVLEKDKTVNMTSSSYGITNKSDPNYYDEDVQLCTRISYSGEYLHSAPWNMADHGKRNTSHGCINLSAGRRAVGLRQLPARRRGRGEEQPEAAAGLGRARRLAAGLRPVLGRGGHR